MKEFNTFLEETNNEYTIPIIGDDSFEDHNGNDISWTFDEIESIRTKEPKRIWTIVDTDDSTLMVINGYHMVNRVGYLVTKDPCPEKYQEDEFSW